MVRTESEQRFLFTTPRRILSIITYVLAPFLVTLIMARSIDAASGVDEQMASNVSSDPLLEGRPNMMEETTSSEKSYFSTPAQVAHAIGFSEKSITQSVVIREAKAQVERAFGALENLGDNATGAEIAEARNTLETAEKGLHNLVAEEVGVTVPGIDFMRQSGMEWSEIAHELGVRPKDFGLILGRDKKTNTTEVEQEIRVEKITTAEIAEATSRNTGKRHGKGHGLEVTASMDPSVGLANYLFGGYSGKEKAGRLLGGSGKGGSDQSTEKSGTKGGGGD